MSDQTREAVAQWLAKARNDWTTVEILLASGYAPAETVCFHCQQYVEKLLNNGSERYREDDADCLTRTSCAAGRFRRGGRGRNSLILPWTLGIRASRRMGTPMVDGQDSASGAR
ncbi:MAG: HEPN domain-containing protein [Sedimentisphaerales bacterium]|nr:HEPN domain-containing protein [Sedimentisphaerales bacterium]